MRGCVLGRDGGTKVVLPTTERVPVLVVTGFLGSGKTTLLNRILQDAGRRVAVIENEYAVEIGVENELVEARKGATFTEIEEVGGQCICHGGLAVFARKLTDLIMYKRDNFDVVVVETTGLYGAVCLPFPCQHRVPRTA